MAAFGSSTYSKRLLHLVSWGHWFTFINIIAAILLSTFYLFAETVPSSLLGKVYLVTTWISHMGFITFMGFVLLIFPITIIYPKTRFIRLSSSIIYSIALLLLLLDAFIYSRLGYHLNASSSDQIIELISSQINQNSRLFWFVSLVLSISILTFELIASNYAWKHLRELQKTIFARIVVTILVISFFFSHLMHIWADANLEYDILRQDTMLPLSYPSTAKTLLTKYQLFDIEDYNERKSSPLSFNQPVSTYPTYLQQCVNSNIKQSTFMVITGNTLTAKQIEHFSLRTQENRLLLNKHVDNALPENAWFNLFYSLPTIYKEPLLADQKQPLLTQVLAHNNMASTLTVISEKEEIETLNNYKSLFNKTTRYNNISSLIYSDTLNNHKPGLHIFYFEQEDNYQYELFVDALLLAQKQKEIKDVIWLSSIGNATNETALITKPALLILPQTKNKTVKRLTSLMDVQTTLLNNWLSCPIESKLFGNGVDITTLSKNRVIANTTPEGMVVFNKDQALLIDQHGNFQSYSSQLKSPISASADFPLMIDGVHFIKQFNQLNTNQPLD